MLILENNEMKAENESLDESIHSFKNLKLVLLETLSLNSQINQNKEF